MSEVAALFATFGWKVDQGSINKINKSITNFATKARSALAGIGLGLGGFQLVKSIVAAGDEYTQLQSRLNLVASSSEEVNTLWERMRKLARDTRSDLGMTVRNFVSITQGVESLNLGLSKSDIADRLELINKQAKISGSSPQATKAAMYQLLTQAIPSDRLGGEELRSVLEQLPSIATQIEKHLGVARGEFRKLSKEGKINSKVILEAFGPQYANAINEQFGKVKKTSADHFQHLKNEVVAILGKFANDADVVGLVAKAVDGLLVGLNALVGALTAISDLFKAAFNGDDGALALVIGIAAAITAFLVPAIWSFAAGVIAATWPFLAIAAVAAGIAFAVIKIAKNWDKVKKAARDALEWLLDLPRRLAQAIVDKLSDAWDAMRDGMQAAFDWVADLPVIKQLLWLIKKLDEATGLTKSANPFGGSDTSAVGRAVAAVSAHPSINAPTANVAERSDAGWGSDQHVAAPITLNVTNNGVKDAEDAGRLFASELKNTLRHARP